MAQVQMRTELCPEWPRPDHAMLRKQHSAAYLGAAVTPQPNGLPCGMEPYLQMQSHGYPPFVITSRPSPFRFSAAPVPAPVPAPGDRVARRSLSGAIVSSPVRKPRTDVAEDVSLLRTPVADHEGGRYPVAEACKSSRLMAHEQQESPGNALPQQNTRSAVTPAKSSVRSPRGGSSTSVANESSHVPTEGGSLQRRLAGRRHTVGGIYSRRNCEAQSQRPAPPDRSPRPNPSSFTTRDRAVSVTPDHGEGGVRGAGARRLAPTGARPSARTRTSVREGAPWQQPGGCRTGQRSGLRRFTEAQRTAYPRALREIRTGRKSSCWMWFVIPTPPYVVNGVEKGSCNNRRFALRSAEEARAYLEFEADGVNLRSNYLEIMSAVRDQLRAGKQAIALMGSLDAPKLRSSAKLFEKVARETADLELHEVMTEMMELLSY